MRIYFIVVRAKNDNKHLMSRSALESSFPCLENMLHLSIPHITTQGSLYNNCYFNTMPYLGEYIPHLWRKAKYSLTPEPSQGLLSIVVKLPPELLLQIADHLDLHDKIQFSQTCIWTHSLFHIDSAAEIAALTYQKRLEFYHEASLRRPRSWVCAECECLHRAEQADVPSRLAWVIDACQNEDNCNLVVPYDLQERHIQLALKLSQGNLCNANQEYLSQLMKPVSQRYTWPLISNLTPGSSTVISHFVAVPRIIEGRFLVHFSWEIYHNLGSPIAYTDIEGTCICPHLEVQQRRHHTRLTRLEISVELAITCDKPQKGWCRYCLTDYTVEVANGRVIIHAWQDFGGQNPPLHHVWARSSIEGHWNGFPEPLYYDSGRVRERFMSQDKD